MYISFNNNEFKLNYDGSIYWINESYLILGDLHLEKSTSFIDQGNFLPPYDTIATLKKLLTTIQTLGVKKIILVGDVFHDSKGYSRLNSNEKNLFDKICYTNYIIGIFGNHDCNFLPKNIKSYHSLKFRGICFSHISTNNNNNEISGHYHPKVTFRYMGRKISKPCFVVAKNKIILPAYGAFTGGLDIKSKTFKNTFKKKFSVYALGNKKVLNIKKDLII